MNRQMKSYHRISMVVVVIALALLARVYCYGPAKGWYYRTFRTPAVLHSPFIEKLDQRQAKAQVQRERLQEIFQGHTLSYGLHKTAYSAEGTPIEEYLIAQAGQLTIISDTTRDAYGIREFTIEHPTAIVLGPIEKSDGWLFTDTNIFSKCYINSKMVHCF